MNEIEKGILGDTIVSIQRLVNFAIAETSKNNYLPDVMYKKHRYLIEEGEDTIEELRKILDGHYEKPKEDLYCKGEQK